MKRFLSNRRLTRRSLLFAKTSSLVVPPGEIGGGRRGGQGCRGGGDRGEEGDRAGRGRRRRRGDGARRRRLRVRREAARGDPLPRDQSYKRLRRGGARGRGEALRAVLGRVHVRRRQRRGRLTEDRREAVRDARRRGEARRGGVARPYAGPRTTASAWLTPILRTFPVVFLRSRLAFKPRPRRLSTPPLTPFNSTPTFARMDDYPQRREGAGGCGDWPASVGRVVGGAAADQGAVREAVRGLRR